MKIKSVGFILILLISITGLKAQLLNNVTVTGTITNAGPSTMVYLSQLVGQGLEPIDSSTIRNDNSFSLSTNIKNSNYFQLTLGGQEYTILILEPNQNIHIDVDANKLMAPKNITGSEDTKKVYTMLSILNSYKAQQDALEMEYQKVYGTPAQDSIGKILIQKYQYLLVY